MVFQLLLAFHVDSGEDFRFPIHRFFAGFFMLCKTRVGPFFVLHCFFMFLYAGVNRAARFSYVYSFLQLHVNLHMPLHLQGGGRVLFFCTENVLELLATFVAEIAACF